jgi:two-component system, chemotaxis family, protein-glutamate methylesterase/glutaminase
VASGTVGWSSDAGSAGRFDGDGSGYSPGVTAQPRDLIVVGASAGGIEALRALMAGLPADLPAAVAVVLHLPAGGTSVLPSILDRAGPLPARHAMRVNPMEYGTVVVAPPNHHLVVIDDHFALTHGPTENGHRPAVNTLFRSAAAAGGPRVIGVQLSGALDDGVAGLATIVAAGGLAVVQDPADALYPAMPAHALAKVSARVVAPAADLGPLLAKLVAERVSVVVLPRPAESIGSNGSGDQEGRTMVRGFSCPDCHGVLVEAPQDGSSLRCRVGHAWSPTALLAAHGDQLERALWTAVRTLEEKTELVRRMRDRTTDRQPNIRQRYESLAEEAALAADTLRRLLASPVIDPTEVRE